jgi:hypothetical protein
MYVWDLDPICCKWLLLIAWNTEVHCHDTSWINPFSVATNYEDLEKQNTLILYYNND